MSSPWITWAGGVRPVPSASIVDVQLRNGAFLRSCYASAFDWMHRPGRDSDVVLFRFSEFANPALAESGIEPKVIPESEKSFEQKFDEFAQAWKESVARVEKKFEWLSESLSRIAATMHREVNLKLSLDTSEASKGLRKFHAGGDTNGSQVWPVGERSFSLDGTPGASLKTNPEKESAPELRPESKAEVQSDFDEMAELICRQILVHGFENDADAEKAIMAHRGTTAMYLRAQFEKMMRQPTADCRERHIMSLWDQARTIVLDGVSYRTDGIDHVPRRG